MKLVKLLFFGFLVIFNLLFINNIDIVLANDCCTAEELADNVPGCVDCKLEAPDPSRVPYPEPSLKVQVLKIVNYFLTFLGLLAVLAIVYAGVMTVGNFGNEDDLSTAKTIFKQAGIGIIIVMISYAFVTWIIESANGPQNNQQKCNLNGQQVSCDECKNGFDDNYNCKEKAGSAETTTCKDANGEDIACSSCKYGFNEDLTCHEKTVSDDKKYCIDIDGQTISCGQCSNGFDDNYNCKEKASSAETTTCKDANGADIACSECQHGFNEDLTCHEKTVSDDKKYCIDIDGQTISCGQCSNGFNDDYNCKEKASSTETTTCKDANGADITCSKCKNGFDVDLVCYEKTTSDDKKYCIDTNGQTISCGQCSNGFDTNYNCRDSSSMSKSYPCKNTSGAEVSCSDCKYGFDQNAICLDSKNINTNIKYCFNTSGQAISCGSCTYGFNENFVCLAKGASTNAKYCFNTSGQAISCGSCTYGFNENFVCNTNPVIDGVNKASDSIGKINNETQTILDKVNNVTNNGIDAINTITNNEQDIIADAMQAQGYSPTIIEDIMQKISQGTPLTTEETQMLKIALQYGLGIKNTEDELKELYEAMPKTDVNEKAYNEAITALTELKMDPTNEDKIAVFEDKITVLKNVIENTVKMIAKIKIEPSSGEAPLIVTLDGSDSVDPNNETIPYSNYKWSYYDNMGSEKVIGEGPLLEYEFTEPGFYVVTLRTTTNIDANGYKTAMDGLSKVKIKVLPPSSSLLVTVNGQEVKSVHQANISEAQEGLIFDASKSVPKIGRKLIEYKWTFGDGTEDYSENGEAITHRYNKVGTYRAKLETTDNTGNTTTKSFSLLIEHLTAKIDISPEKGDIDTSFNISASNSKSSDFKIYEYEWEIRDSSNELVGQYDSVDFNFKAKKPGKHSVKLSIYDAENQSVSTIKTINIISSAPHANFSVKQKAKSWPSTYIFDASTSSDPENDTLTYSWDFDGDNFYDVKDRKDMIVEYSYNKVGAYKPRLQVKDKYGETSETSSSIKVDSILDVDFDMSVLATHIDKEITFIPKSKKAVAYYWNFGNETNRSANSAEKQTYIYKQAGKYLITLTVFDKQENENSVTKSIFIGDGKHPIAAYDISIDGQKKYPEVGVCGENNLGLIVDRTNNLQFSANSSLNIDGSSHMLDYNWDFGDGDFSNSKVANHRYLEVTEKNKCYTVSLTVKDRNSAKASLTEKFYIQVNNSLPTLQELVIKENTLQEKITPYQVDLQAQGAIDKDGRVEKYRWWYRNVNDDKDTKQGLVQTNKPNASLTITSDGLAGMINQYIFVVELTDNDGATVNSEDLFGAHLPIEVENGNVFGPIASFEMDKNQIYPGDTISFIATAEDPQDNDTTGMIYKWDFDGDNIFDEISTSPQISRQFNIPGEFFVRLRVENNGLAHSVKQKVYVDKISQYPLAAFTYKVEGLNLFADASVSRYDPALADKTLRFAWDFDRNYDADGDGVSSNDVESTAINPSFTYDKKGTYYVVLKVIDSLGGSSQIEHKVLINADDDDASLKTANISKSTIKINSRENAITTLDLSIQKQAIYEGETIILSAKVLNADGSIYEDEVEFEIIRGQAFVSEDIVKAINGIAKTNITGFGAGNVIIKATAKNTFYQTLTEQIILEVLPKPQNKASSKLSESDINVREIRKQNYINN